MSRWICKKCAPGIGRFRTNSKMEMIDHAIEKHFASYTKSFVKNVACNDQKLKQKVMEKCI